MQNKNALNIRYLTPFVMKVCQCGIVGNITQR